MTAMPREKASSYYPPRARWYSPAFGALDAMRRRVALDRLNPVLVPDVNLLDLVGSFLVPAFGFYLRVPALPGRTLLAWALLLLVAFFAFLGRWEDNFIFGMLLSLHVSGFVFYCTPLFGSALPQRLGFTACAALAMYLLLYLPTQSLLQNYVVEPLQVQGRIVIVGPISSPKSIRTGDWIAYTIKGGYENEMHIEEGTSFAQVLAVAGDRVTFDGDTYRINGVAHPRLPNMPQSGTQVVPEKEWFVWPNLAIHERVYIGESRVPELLLRLALVTQDQLVGKPFQRWFWWRQELT